MAESSTLLERPSILEQHQDTAHPEKTAKLIEQIVNRAKNNETVTAFPLELVISQLDHDDAAALIPLAFNQKVAAAILGEGYEQVLEEMFQHIVEYVAKKSDPGTWQSFIALITNPVIARMVWGPSYKQNLRQMKELILEDLAQGQKVSRNGHRR